MSLESKAELLMAIEDYKLKGTKKRDGGLDITALDNGSNDKVLLRLITRPKSKSGYVGADTAERLVAAIEKGNYDKGVLIGEKLTKAAKRRLAEEGIQIVSKETDPDFRLKRLFFVAENLVDDLCKAKCGKIPHKKSDCKGHSNGHYSCKTRLISDNASFHFERGWKDLLQKDALQLLSMHHSAND